jgi:hypothetical protein
LAQTSIGVKRKENEMKKTIGLIVGLMVLGLAFAPGAFADSASSGTAKVLVNVDPIIAITPTPPAIITVQAGKFVVPVTFTIGANKQEVTFSAAGTDLWKADDPTGTEVAPIPFDQTKNCTLTLTNGNALDGADNKLPLPYTGTDAINGFPAYLSGSKTFQSSQSGHFSQDVILICGWNQNDSEKPKGQYSGYVRLIGVIVPDP